MLKGYISAFATDRTMTVLRKKNKAQPLVCRLVAERTYIMPTRVASASRRSSRADAPPRAGVPSGCSAIDEERPLVSTVPTTVGTGAQIKDSLYLLRQMGGSKVDAFNSVILRETLSTVWCPNTEDDNQAKRVATVAAALSAFEPKDEIEGMLAAQAVALHFGAMECLRRAMIHEQPFEVATKLRKDGANLARGMTDMLEAIDRKRGKGPQVVRVERVTVHEGGQAVVGNVATAAGGGGY